MNTPDTIAVVGMMLGAFGIGYATSHILLVFRKVMDSIT